jgi:hypothetical protein
LEEVELAQIELIFLSGLYGPVPEAHVHEEPVTTYDFLLHKKDTIGTAEVSKRLSSLLDRFSDYYSQVVAYSTQPAYRRVIELAFMGRENVKLLPEKGRNVRTSFYKTENIEDLTKFLKIHLCSG